MSFKTSYKADADAMRVTIIKLTVNYQKKKRVCAYERVSTDSLSQGESPEKNILHNIPEKEKLIEEVEKLINENS